MTGITFKEFLFESFREGIYYRELRLSEDELDTLRSTFPTARITKTTEVNDLHDKAWYEVNLLSANKKTESVNSILSK